MLKALLREVVRGLFDVNLPDHVERGPGGGLMPAPGFSWLNDMGGDYRVRWCPGKEWPGTHLVAGDSPGKWHPVPGYQWLEPGDAACERVVWMPGSAHGVVPLVFAAETEGKWRAAPGYRFLNRDPGDLRVVPKACQQQAASDSVPAGRVQRIKDLATLGLDEEAGLQAIEGAFRRLVRVHHPDRFAGRGAEAVEAAGRSFRLLREAFERLRGA
ncbi:MAG: J domain-containing protein [Planctomycetota bacterium]